MFSPAPMVQLKLMVLQEDKRLVLRTLGELGVVEFEECAEGPDTAPIPAAQATEQVAQCGAMLNRVAELRHLLQLAGSEESPHRHNELNFTEAQAHLRLLDEQTASLLSRRETRLKRTGQLTALCDQLSGYRDTGLPLDEPERLSFLHFLTGTIPAANLRFVQKRLGNDTALLPLAQRGEVQALLALTTHAGRSNLERLLGEAGFRQERLPIGRGTTADQSLDSSLRELAQVKASLRQTEAGLRALADKVRSLLTRIEAAVQLEKCLVELERDFPRTEKTVLMSGWLPASDRARLEQRLQKLANGRFVLKFLEPAGGRTEGIPVLLRHARLLRPFEMLVTAYGFPGYKELEPTVFVAISYVLMFGMMFGDVGHGAVLALGGLAALKTGRSVRVRDFAVLLLYGGVSSLLFGLAYGSWFGLPQFKPYALWQDPLEGNPMVLLASALKVGGALISLGLVLNIINRFRRGDVIGALLGKFGLVGLFFYWGMWSLLTQGEAINALGAGNLLPGIIIGLPLTGWLLKEPLEYAFRRRRAQPEHKDQGRGLGQAFTESLLGAFEAVLSYFANTVSFVRLAAYAMSHAALLVAAFMLAGAVRHLPVGGGLLGTLVVIVGNLAVIAFEGVVACVQALRLEYYEFFGKFFAGNGRPFMPFQLKTFASGGVL